jgi:hypothetical protein
MDIYHYLKTFHRKKGAIPQSECLRQAPNQIKNIYNTYYIGKEKEFIELLLYVKENNNLERVLEAVEELSIHRFDHVTTDRILFICEQSAPSKKAPSYQDETTDQSVSNIEAYTNMFNQVDGRVMSYG